MKFKYDWLDRYLRPERCIHDNGGEFTGIPFIHMLVLNGIKNGTIIVKNPQTNAICECLHQSISNIQRDMLKAHPPIKEFQVQNIVDTSLLHHMQLELQFIVHCVFSPGTWVFQHDLITDM